MGKKAKSVVTHFHGVSTEVAEVAEVAERR
jgi:hypothetical protein